MQSLIILKRLLKILLADFGDLKSQGWDNLSFYKVIAGKITKHPRVFGVAKDLKKCQDEVVNVRHTPKETNRYAERMAQKRVTALEDLTHHFQRLPWGGK